MPWRLNILKGKTDEDTVLQALPLKGQDLHWSRDFRWPAFPLKTSVWDPVCVACTCCRFYNDTVLSNKRLKVGKGGSKCAHAFERFGASKRWRDSVWSGLDWSRSWYFAFVLLHFCKRRIPKCPKQACAIWNFEKYPAPEFPGLPSYKPRSAASSERDECRRLGSPGHVSALRTVSSWNPFDKLVTPECLLRCAIMGPSGAGKTSQSLGLAWAVLQRPLHLSAC